MAQSHPQTSKTLTSAMIQSYWTCASCIMLSGADITILVQVFMMHENASTHHWHMQNYKYALHRRCFFSGQKSTGVSQHLLRRNYSSSSLPFPISDLISTVPTKLMTPALSTMHKEKWKALSHLNGKYSESLEKDKANIKNHKKYVYCTPMYFLHTHGTFKFSILRFLKGMLHIILTFICFDITHIYPSASISLTSFDFW